MITLRDGSQPLRKTFLGWKTDKKTFLKNDLKGAQAEFTVASFLRTYSKKREVTDLESGTNLTKVESSNTDRMLALLRFSFAKPHLSV